MPKHKPSPVFLDSFHGALADLPPRRRRIEHMLAALEQSPSVSTWEMDEHAWLREALATMEKQGLIVALTSAYPWHTYALTDAGRRMRGGGDA